ncbi:MAG: STAS domain-containing protein [Planctomycetota bacterium]
MNQEHPAHVACLHLPDGVAHATFPLGRFDGVAVRELFELSNRLPPARGDGGGDGPRLLIDTTGVAFVPSGGMGMLLTIRKRFLAGGGQLHVALPDPGLMRSFRVANLHRLLDLFETVEQARDAFRR